MQENMARESTQWPHTEFTSSSSLTARKLLELATNQSFASFLFTYLSPKGPLTSSHHAYSSLMNQWFVHWGKGSYQNSVSWGPLHYCQLQLYVSGYYRLTACVQRLQQRVLAHQILHISIQLDNDSRKPPFAFCINKYPSPKDHSHQHIGILLFSLLKNESTRPLMTWVVIPRPSSVLGPLTGRHSDNTCLLNWRTMLSTAYLWKILAQTLIVYIVSSQHKKFQILGNPLKYNFKSTIEQLSDKHALLWKKLKWILQLISNHYNHYGRQ